MSEVQGNDLGASLAGALRSLAGALGARGADAHVDPDLLAAFAAGDLEDEPSRRVLEHLAACRDRRCNALVRWEVGGREAAQQALAGPIPAPRAAPKPEATPHMIRCRDVLWDTFTAMAQAEGRTVDDLVDEAMDRYRALRQHVVHPGGANPSEPGLGAPPSLEPPTLLRPLAAPSPTRLEPIEPPPEARPSSPETRPVPLPAPTPPPTRRSSPPRGSAPPPPPALPRPSSPPPARTAIRFSSAQPPAPPPVDRHLGELDLDEEPTDLHAQVPVPLGPPPPRLALEDSVALDGSVDLGQAEADRGIEFTEDADPSGDSAKNR